MDDATDRLTLLTVAAHNPRAACRRQFGGHNGPSGTWLMVPRCVQCFIADGWLGVTPPVLFRLVQPKPGVVCGYCGQEMTDGRCN